LTSKEQLWLEVKLFHVFFLVSNSVELKEVDITHAHYLLLLFVKLVQLGVCIKNVFSENQIEQLA
jgi:hypothetical protein